MANTVSGDMTDASFAKEFEKFKNSFDFSAINPLTQKDNISKVKETFNATLTVLKGIKNDT